MFAILQLWWPVLVLLHLPLLVNTIAVTLFKRIAHTHDWELADDLPQTAGEWLRDRAVVRGLRVVATEKESDSDGFHPDHRVIQLNAVTHFKSDPVYWAIAEYQVKNPSAGMRVFDLLRLSYVPLIIAIGGGLIT